MLRSFGKSSSSDPVREDHPREPPFQASKTMLRLLGLFNPLMRALVAMHYLMTAPLIMNDSALQRLTGPIPKTPCVEGIRQTLAALRKIQFPAIATA
ncbi:hypothetical protein D9M68_350970 [compost metagenome]